MALNPSLPHPEGMPAGFPFQPQRQKLVQFRRETLNPTPLGQGQPLGALLNVFLPGQATPIHAAAVEMVLLVLRGRGWLCVGKGEVELGPGSVALVPAGTPRVVRATTKLAPFQVVAPSVTEADHSKARR